MRGANIDPRRIFLAVLLGLPGALAAGANGPLVAIPPVTLSPPGPASGDPPAVMLGIDVLEAEGFAAIKGKRIGLLTHPAGVNRRGASTIDVLRRAPGVQLVTLFGPEHGLYGDAAADALVADTVDQRTGLPVHSLYAQTKKPTRAMLRGIDALVIDLQDIGTRSYTFVSAMKRTMEGCFENDVEVIVLDRPNPLGGLKVDGPPLDAAWSRNNYVAAFRVPYVHGLTIGELARMTKAAPSLHLPDELRARGRLTVVPMRGWSRAMRWPDTGLNWVPPSGGIKDFEAVQGYAMVGLGCFFDPASGVDLGFRHGVGVSFPFRGLTNKYLNATALERELNALHLPGLHFRRVAGKDPAGQPTPGIYVDIADYDAWRPAELNFHLMKLAARLAPENPFARKPGRSFTLFLMHMGSTALLDDLALHGAAINLEAWLRRWREQAEIYQQQSRRYWLYR